MAVHASPLARPAASLDRAGLRLPGWLTWGGAIGLVQLFALLTFGPLGVSTAYPQVVGWLGEQAAPGFAAGQPYLKVVGASIGWEVMLVVGLSLGALVSALLAGRSARSGAGGESAAEAGAVCVSGFTGGRTRRYLRAFAGGFLFIFGARLAGGCTTGHILSGTAQLAVSGLVFTVATFAAAMLVARLLFREPASAGAAR